MSPLTWFHFSDLHFKSVDDFDRSRVLNTLWADIAKQIAEGLLPDFIIISGDIAYSGKASEYERAEREFLIPLLEKTGVSRKRIYFVPGNHDFDREYLESLNPVTIQSLGNRDHVNALLSDAKKRELYLQPFHAYSDFVRRFTSGEYFKSSPAFSYCDTFSHGGMTIRIVGLNTAWACNYRSSGKEPSDKGRLLLGEFQLAQTAILQGEQAFTICAMHHPVDWLAEFEIAMLRQQLLQGMQILHHGHVHLASEIAHSKARNHDCIILGAAACYDRRIGNDFYANGYSILSLSPQQGNVTLKLRRYVDSPAPHWSSNEDVLGEGSRGEHRFALSIHSLESRPPGTSAAAVVTSIDELCRLSSKLAPHVPALRKLISLPQSSKKHSPDNLLARYEELVCAIVSESSLHRSNEETLAAALSAVFGTRFLQLAATGIAAKATTPVAASLNQVSDELLSAMPSEFAQAIRTVTAIWRSVSENWNATPYSLTQIAAVGTVLHATGAPVAALVVLLVSEPAAAVEVIHVEAPRLESGIDLQLPRLLRSRLQGASIIELTIPDANATQFMVLSLIRFHLEGRIEKIVEAFATADHVFPIQAVRLQLLQAPDTWTEQKFTVDTPRIIHLLMGSELYGGHSKDVWFRELLQNAIDACACRKRIEEDSYDPLVSMSYSVEDRKFSIIDNGLGMNRAHIDWYLCRVGRSIWRSEELTKQFKDKTTKKMSIGRFGVGFLSVFEAASEVVVTTRHCKDGIGHQLRITSPQEPFFVKEANVAVAGTEIQLRFPAGYEPSLYQLARLFLVYRPKICSLIGVADIPEHAEAALDREIREAGGEDLVWHKAQEQLTSISATIHVAIPILGKVVADKKDPFPSQSKIRLSNGGIAVGETSGEWIGAEREYGETPSSGVNGIVAIVDFETGFAPVTVSRNGVKVSEADARQVVEMFAKLCGDAWRLYAEELFSDAGDRLAKTRVLLRALNRSAKIPGWRSMSKGWAENDILVSKAVSILKEFGLLEVQEDQAGNKIRSIGIGELAESDEQVTLTTAELAKSYLFQLYWRQRGVARLILVPDARSALLLQACNPKWRIAKSDGDIWELVEITERRDLKLCSLIPAEVAFADKSYFKDDSYFTASLPRKRARPQDVVGMSRFDAVDISPRVLLNCDHVVWTRLERRLLDGKVAEESIRDAFKMLLGLVIDEKSKTRREHEFRSVLKRFLGLAELKSDTAAKIEYS
ncbi:MAG: metallophosphoesterase [Verrucomicrobiaceae bacterium]|nr:metallophosphoesterase [Verrucomicrobiaceae bacterium]